MKPFFITVGTVFGLIVIAHIARIVSEPGMAGDPWYWILTIVAAGLSGWSWRLLWTSRGRGGPGSSSTARR
jgi:hypothetical protein